MHRALSDGELSWDGGEYPLNHVILGGEPLYTEDDYIMVLKTPVQVRDVAAVLPKLTEAEFRRRYDRINPDSYGFTMDDEDFGYTWHWFQESGSPDGCPQGMIRLLSGLRSNKRVVSIGTEGSQPEFLTLTRQQGTRDVSKENALTLALQCKERSRQDDEPS